MSGPSAARPDRSPADTPRDPARHSAATSESGVARPADVPSFLLTWAAQPGPRRVLAAIRDRLEQGRLGPRARIAIALSPPERRDVGRLLDATWERSGAAVPVRSLRAGFATHGTTLESVLVATGGPLRDLPAERRTNAAERAADVADGLAALTTLLGPPIPDGRLPAVHDALRRWVIRRHPGRRRATEVADIVRSLPSAGPCQPAGASETSPPDARAGASAAERREPSSQTNAIHAWSPGDRLAVVAASLTGDAHALDRSRTLGRAVARFLALQAGIASGIWEWDADPISTPDDWRNAWASAGIACDAVSARVLVLNLPLAGTAPAVALSAATPGEPVWLSLRSMTGTLTLADAADVYVCENPTIVETAADRLGARSRPLICTFGRPDAAAMTLLRAIAPPARLHVRADGDAAGWSIVRGLLTAIPDATRWRMEDGTTSYEEEIVDSLIDDLSCGRPPDGI